MKKVILVLLTIFLIVSTTLFAQRTSDIEGSKDYPLVSRFKGSVIEWYKVKNFDRYYMLSIKDNKINKYEIEGKITRIQYSSQKGHSVFEIYKSYENALKEAGFRILLRLDKTNCGANLSELLYIGEFNGLNALKDKNSIKPDFREGEFAYLSAKKKIDNKNIYIVVYITNWNYPLITFDAIEVKSLEKGLVTVKDMEKDLSENGHIAIYNIYFDTGKSDLKPASANALKVIAEYLKAHPDKKYFIVGHTDNSGNFDSNMKLSKNRAISVMKELITKYGVSANQIKAYGIANLSPVTTNNNAAARARNRRVEIVEQ